MQVNHRFVLTYGLLVTLSVALVLFLDAQGVFIYFGYVPIYLLAGLVSLAGLILFGRAGRERRGHAAAALLGFTAALFLVVVTCPNLPTSSRKRFFLAAMALKPGMTLNEVKARMAPYDAHPFPKYPGSLTFSYESRRGTVDAALVKLSTTGERVTDISFSVD